MFNRDLDPFIFLFLEAPIAGGSNHANEILPQWPLAPERHVIATPAISPTNTHRLALAHEVTVPPLLRPK
jgi:hypothetical protein